MGSILRQWLPNGKIQGGEYVALNPKRQDNSEGSFKVNLRTGYWADFAYDNVKGRSMISLASSLLKITGEENGGFHFRGASSLGKSTALNVASSILGGGKTPYIQQWRSTSNALEETAEAHNDTLLCLDELGQIDGKQAGEVAYMLANGSGKSRMRDKGGLRKKHEWRLLFLSSGEISLADKMLEVGKRVHAGMEVRLIDIPADTGKFGLFEELHGFANGAEFSRHLNTMSKRYYGTAIRTFIESLVGQDWEEIQKFTKEQHDKMLYACVSDHSDGQVKRVAARFALLSAAGLLAIKAGILPFEDSEICNAIMKCYSAWLQNRGTEGSLEIKHGVEQVVKFFEQHSSTRFALINAMNNQAGDVSINDAEKVISRAGYRRKDKEAKYEYLVFPAVFREEICKGYDARTILRELAKRGLLHTESDGRLDKNIRLPVEEGSKPKRMYHFSSSILSGGDTN
jgi:putative DNA primase/helicase